MSCTRLHSVLDDVAKEFDCDDPMARSITGAFLLAVGAAAPAARAEDQDGESTSLVTVSDLSGSTNQTQTLPEATAVVRSEGTVEGERTRIILKLFRLGGNPRLLDAGDPRRTLTRPTGVKTWFRSMP